MPSLRKPELDRPVRIKSNRRVKPQKGHEDIGLIARSVALAREQRVSQIRASAEKDSMGALIQALQENTDTLREINKLAPIVRGSAEDA